MAVDAPERVSGSLDRELWRFAVSFYGRPGVAPACLLLQDRLGLDVNLLLFSLFAVRRGFPLAPEEVTEADAAVRDWRAEVDLPLRRVRTRLKSGPEPAPSPDTDQLRNSIKAAELRSEQIELAALSAWLERREARQAPVQSGIRSEARLALVQVARHFAGAGSAALDDPAVAEALRLLAQAADEPDPADPDGQTPRSRA